MLDGDWQGFQWKKVRSIIDRVFADWPGTLYVYEEYVPEDEGAAATSG